MKVIRVWLGLRLEWILVLSQLLWRFITQCLCLQIVENMPRKKIKKKQFSKRSVHQSEKTREVNPFELKVSRQKHEVFGRKMSKTDKGMPGVSRSKAIRKVHLYNLYLFSVHFAFIALKLLVLVGQWEGHLALKTSYFCNSVVSEDCALDTWNYL